MRVNTVPSNCTSGSSTPETYHLNDLGSPPDDQDPSQEVEPPVQQIPLENDEVRTNTHTLHGWLIALATSIVAILVPHLSLCHGMVASLVIRTFPSTSWTAVAGLYTAMLVMWNVMGPVTNLLHLAYSSRCISLVGGILLSLGLSLSVVAPNIFILYVTLGIMTGCGAGLVENTSGKILKWYLNTRHDVVSHTCLFMRSVGQMLVPQCLLLLLDCYGLHGGLLVLGGVTLHVCAAALIFPGRNNSQSCFRCKQPEQKKALHFQKNNSTVTSSNAVLKKKRKKKKRKKSIGDKDLSEDRRWKNPSYEQMGMYQRSHRMRTISLDSSRMLPDIPEEQEPMEDEDDDEEEDIGATQGKQLLSNEENAITAIRRIRQESITSSVSYASSGSWEQRRNSLSSSLSSIYSDSSLSITSSVYSEEVENMDQRNSVNGELRSFPNSTDIYWRFSDYKLLFKEPVLWILTVSFTCLTLVSSNVLLYVPIQTLHLGLTLQHVACLLSLYVVINIVGRLVAMWLYSKRVKPQLIYMLMGFCIVLSIGGLVFANIFSLIAVCVAIFGCASGACNVIMSPLLLSTFEGRIHATAVAFIQIAQAILFAVGMPLIGLLVEMTGSLLSAFSLLIPLQALSVIVWSFQPLAEKCRNIDTSNSDIPDL